MESLDFTQETKLIISSKETRKILGKRYDYLTDEDIEALIKELEALAEIALDAIWPG